jgi:hypothetical protein
MNRIANQRPYHTPLPLHESEQVALMRRVAHIFMVKHDCTAEFSNWKVTDMTVAELQYVDNQYRGESDCRP